jgi:hypothetical protein
VEVNGVDVTGSMAVPPTGGYQTWQTVTKSGVALTAGTQTVRLLLQGNASNGGAGNFNWLEFTTGAAPPPPSPGPYGGTPAPVPGTIQAENFDEGGEGVAYHDTTAINSGNSYRTSAVDIGPVTGGGYYVGWTRPTEWLQYTVNVTAAGTYTLDIAVANKGTGGKFHVEVDGVNVTGSISLPNTGDWQRWQTVTRTGINLGVGQRIVRLVFDTGTAENGGVGNYDYLRFR